MFFKLLIFAIAGIFVYKLLGGKLPKIGRSSEQKKLDDDTLIECEKCDTYATVKESLVINGKYYCSNDCSPK